MNILLCFNDCFTPLARVLIISLMCHHNNLHFYIGYTKLSEENRRELKYLVEEKCPNGNWPWDDGEFRKDTVERTIDFLEFTTNESFRIYSHLSIDTWTRCFIWERIPVDRLLYLDADIIVNGNIEQFYHDYLGDNLLKACPDYYCYGLSARNIRWGPPMLEALQRDHGYKNEFGHYCNAGVVLFNVAKMREEGITSQKIIGFYHKLTKPLVMNDQDCINLFFEGRIKLANPYRYNCTIPPLTRMKDEHFSRFADIDMSEAPYANANDQNGSADTHNPSPATTGNATGSKGVAFDKNNILIYHYSANVKPNKTMYRHLYADVFWRYQFMDPQAPASLHVTRVLQKCWGTFRRSLPDIHIDLSIKKKKNEKQ